MHPAIVTMLNTIATAVATAKAAKAPVNEILIALKLAYRRLTVPS